MAPRRSLAEKYAQSRTGLNPDTYSRSLPQQPLPSVRALSPSYEKSQSTYTRSSLKEKYENFQRRQDPKQHKFSYSGYRSDPFQDTTRPQAGRVAKPNTKNSKGLLGRVKNFLNNFGLDALDWDSSNYKPLEKSISSLAEPSNELFRAKRAPSPVSETIDYNKIFELRDSKRQVELDEVTPTIEQRRVREQEAKLELLKDSMQRKLELELSQRREAEADYERKLYLLKSDFEARLFALEERMEAMRSEADEHSKVLRAQSTAELMEQKEAIYMGQIESAAKIRNLNALIAEKEKEMERMKEKLDDLSSGGLQTQTDPKNNDRLIKSILDGEEDKSDTRPNDKKETLEDTAFLETWASENEAAVIEFYEALQKSPLTVEDHGQLHMLGSRALSKRVEQIMLSLDARAGPSEMASQLDDYESYFNSCSTIKQQDPRHMRQLYQKHTIDGIEDYFMQVSALTRRKINQGKARMRQLQSRFHAQRLDNLTLKKADKIASDLEARLLIHRQCQQNLALLVRLAQLMQKITEIRALLQ